jgi:predicted TIM-barrel fold metal-dependent hydrolase
MPEPHRIDVHAHALPDFYMGAVEAAGIARSKGKPYPAWSPDLHLRLMDKNGIRTSILSFSTPHVHFGDAGRALDLARRCNDYLASLRLARPERFGSFAVLPLPDVESACREAIRALDDAGADGVTVLASYGRVFLGGPEFDPLFAELDKRSAVVFVHPTQHPEAASLGLDLPLFVAEYPVNTTRAALNLMTKGVLTRFPRIRFLLAHAGGVLPYLAWRLGVPRRPPVFEEAPAVTLQRFWYDIALAAGPQTLGTLMEVANPARVLFGSDWPYTEDETVDLTVRDSAAAPMVSPEQAMAIDQGNALALFPRLA